MSSSAWGAEVEGRLHPLSPFVNGWKWFAGAVALAAPRTVNEFDVLLSGVLLLVALVVAAAYGFVSWRFTRYGFAGEDFRLETGVLFRRSRRVRLDRLQAVDVVRPLLARMLGLAELRLEVVGGVGSSEAPLAYLSEADAQRLRAELLARAAGLRHGDAEAPEAPERVLYRVPPLQLAMGGLLTTPVVVGVVAIPLVLLASVATRQLAAAFLLVPAVMSIGGPVVQQFVRNFEFTLAESPDGLRLRRGLAETRAQTVPPGRVQAVRLVEPWLWRRFTDWVRLEVTVAGYGRVAGEAGVSSGLLLPVAPRAAALAVLRHVLPGVDVDAIPLAPAPARSRWVDPFAARVLAVGWDERALVTRRGLLERRLDVMPHAKTQSVRWMQGPLQRRLSLASVAFDTTPGPVQVRAPHRDAREALALVDGEIERARNARTFDPPERWMARAVEDR